MSRRRLPPLNALKAFEAMARHERLTDAAAELGVTHGAISRQIRHLEEVLGTDLFMRRGRTMALSAGGRRLQPTLTAAFDMIAGAVEQVTARQRDELTVSCLGTFAMRWLIPRLYRFRSAHPEIRVRISTSDDDSDLSRGGVDAAFRVGRGTWPELWVATEFLHERIGPVMSRSLFERQPVATVDDLRTLPLLHTATRPSAWHDWSAATGRPDLTWQAGEHFDHFYYMLRAAESGLGVAIGPEPLVADDIAAGHLVAPLGFVDSGMRYALLLQHEPPQAAATFRGWVLSEAARAADMQPVPPT